MKLYLKNNKLHVIFLLLLFLLQGHIIYATSDVSVKIYGDGCIKCFEDYSNELIESLNQNGIYTIETFFMRHDYEAKNELLDIKEKLNVPNEMQNNFLSVAINEKYLFEGNFPKDLILEFVLYHINEYDSLVTSYDPILGYYKILGNKNMIICEDKVSISNCAEPSEVKTYTTGLPIIIVSGLLDGINPCAFAVLLFFIALIVSTSSSSDTPKKNIIKMGASYIIGVFISYLTIGLILYQTILNYLQFNFVTIIGSGILLIIGLLNIKDYISPEFGPSIRLSSNGWEITRKWMRKLTIPASFISGFLVGLFEFPCTGATYLTIISLLSRGNEFITGLKLLIIYNIAFIIPLIIVFLFTFFIGYDTFSINNWKKNHERKMKLFSGIAFIIIALIIVYVEYTN